MYVTQPEHSDNIRPIRRRDVVQGQVVLIGKPKASGGDLHVLVDLVSGDVGGDARPVLAELIIPGR